MKQTVVLLFILFTCFTNSQEVILNKAKIDSLAKSNTDEVPLNEVISIIDSAPVYPGCEKKASYNETKRCMSQKIANLYKDNFNTILHEDSNLEPGIKNLTLLFKVDKTGNLIDIKAKAPDEHLEEEMLRVSKLIPKFTPGYKKNEPAIIPFSLRLMIEVEANKNLGRTSYPLYDGCKLDTTYINQRKCFEQKVDTFFKNNFSTVLHKKSKLEPGKHRFIVEFNIDEKGRISDIFADGEDEYLINETLRVAKLLPQVTPGYKKDEAIVVRFSKIISVNMTKK